MRKLTFTLIVLLGSMLTAMAGQPKYVFYFIGDGMGLGHVLSTETYNRTVLGNSEHITMLQFPVTTMCTSYSASSKITDSAAAGTALSTGTKINNYALGITPSGENCYSLATELKKQGYGIAIASSVPIDDATPAAFYAHVANRKMFYEIGLDLAKSGYDFFAGTKLRGLKDNDGKENDLMKTIKKSGYEVVYGAEGYNREKGKKHPKMLLLSEDNGQEHNGFTIDSTATNLTLEFITAACMEHLQKYSPDKFFMMVEGGNIDWAAHANDGGTVIKEILNFNKSIALAYEFYKQHPEETLIVVTADHNTGGMALGVSKGPKEVDLSVFDSQRTSLELFQKYCFDLQKSGKQITWDEMKEILKAKLGLFGAVKVSEKREKALREAFNRTFVTRDAGDEKTLYATFSEFVKIVFDVQNHCAGIGWTSTNHTGDFTPVFAVGAGAEQFGGLRDNTDLPRIMLRLAGAEDK
ncbi:MAG: alkaline phosphatase [Muribaculaceae bacterium]